MVYRVEVLSLSRVSVCFRISVSLLSRDFRLEHELRQDSIFTLFLARMYVWQIIQFRNLLFRDFRLVVFNTTILCFAGIVNISHEYEYLELNVSIVLATK